MLHSVDGATASRQGSVGAADNLILSQLFLKGCQAVPGFIYFSGICTATHTWQGCWAVLFDTKRAVGNRRWIRISYAA
eukprot:scaffold36584_cov153-Amphora_coffeaeformis.AAC.1